MKILFLSLGMYDSIKQRGIYTDLLREFIKNGDEIVILSPVEDRVSEAIIEEEHCKIIKVPTGKIQKTNIVEKGINTILIETRFINAIKKHLKAEKFDLVLYPTPPITFVGAVKYVKKRNGARTYLLLKDIFPQNSVDLGMLKTTGLKGMIYKYFRYKEKCLYAVSDTIGCMSQANVNYVLKHNLEIRADKVEICPNCIEPIDLSLDATQKQEIRKKYNLPLDKKIFVYGGNLGRPQDVPFIVECLKACVDIKDIFFVIAGSGTDRHYLEEYVEAEKPKHVKVFGYISKDEYDRMIACCDVGLIFLDHRFTIPNFPSRLLSYMQAGLPVLACTDKNTDIGNTIVTGGFGWWCESTDASKFKKMVIKSSMEIEECKMDYFHCIHQHMLLYYNVCSAYKIIMKK